MSIPFSAEFIGTIAFLISITGSAIYIWSILRRETKPHFYTWLVFGILTAIAFFAQLHDRGGPGAWTMGISAFSCAIIALLALRYGEQDIKKSDKIALSASLLAILPWLMTKDPLWSVILVSAIDGIVMFPTLRKSWDKPYAENLNSYYIANTKTLLSLTALTNLTVTTALYPVATVLVNTSLILLCLWRRKIIATEGANL